MAGRPAELPLPRKPKLIGSPSAARSIISRFHGPDVIVVAVGAVGRPDAAAEERGDAIAQAGVDLLR